MADFGVSFGGGGGGGGANGKSAYEVAVDNGFTGTEAEWLESLEGLTAYEVALANGFVGTEAEWLASLQGSDGGGGGAASLLLTAGTSLTALKGVTLDASGDVFPIQETNVPGAIGPTTTISGTEKVLADCHVPTLDVIYQFILTGGGSTVSVRIGSHNAQRDQITWGSPILLNQVSNIPVCVYNEVDDTVVAFFRRAQENNLMYAVTLTPGATSFTEGPRQAISGTTYTSYFDCTYLKSLDQVVLVNATSNGGSSDLRVRRLTFSGNTPSVVENYLMEANTSGYGTVFAMSDSPSTFAISYSEGSALNVVKVGRFKVSGATLLRGADFTAVSLAAGHHIRDFVIAANPISNRVAWVYYDDPPSGDNIKRLTMGAYPAPGDLGTPQLTTVQLYLHDIFTTGGRININDVGVGCYLEGYLNSNPDQNRYYLFSREDGPSKPINIGPGQMLSQGPGMNSPSVTVENGGERIYLTFPINTLDTRTAVIVPAYIANNADLFDGIALTSVAPSEPVEILVPGGYTAGFTGLTPRQKIYVQPNGDISQVVNGEAIGEAINSTTIILYGRTAPVDNNYYVQHGRNFIPLIDALTALGIS